VAATAMTVRATNNQLKAAAEKNGGHGHGGNSNSSGHKQQSIKSGSGDNGGHGSGGGNGGGDSYGDGDSCKDNKDGDNDGIDNSGSRSGGSGTSVDGRGDSFGGALGNLPLVNKVTIMSMRFLTRPATLTLQNGCTRTRVDRMRGRGGDGQQCNVICHHCWQWQGINPSCPRTTAVDCHVRFWGALTRPIK
jgi:hypothetical protein